jgi:sterol desaturase/sphingolipid hydroxylase (fatty acid hydroxylase superfamily)
VTPAVAQPRSIRIATEARKARHRLYPVSIVYSLFSVAVLAIALNRRPDLAIAFYALGIVFWTAVEYWVHRYILHGRFPDGPGFFQHFLHKYFDHLHWEHHKRPWDGNHINGTLADTLPFLGPLALVSLLLPVETLSAFLAGLMQAYIVEEWVHHSVHFYRFRGRYFRYIKRHHLYHHSPKGDELGYGLTNGFWDIIFNTRISAEQRRLLYARTRTESEMIDHRPASAGPLSAA